MKCQICSVNEMTNSFTKCCRSFVCIDCKEKYQKKGSCFCGKFTNGKKLTFENVDIFEVIKNYYQSKPQECSRCEEPASVECSSCTMLFCKSCNQEIHNGLGFSKHHRKTFDGKKLTEHNFQKIKRKQFICRDHNQHMLFGCDCGVILCNSCSKNHKESCSKGGKIKSLKQFKEEYFLNILWKLKQITLLKEKLGQDKAKYMQNFQKQKQSYQICSKAMNQQFSSLKRMLQIKIEQIQGKHTKYWRDCEKVYLINLQNINENLMKYDDLSKLIERFSQNLLNIEYIESKIKRVYTNFDGYSFKVQNIDQIQGSLLNLGLTAKEWQIWNNQSPQNNIILGESLQRFSFKDDLRIFGKIDNIQQLLYDYTQHPQKPRVMNLISSHNQICFSFLHLPHQLCSYEIQYGVGIKMKGQEIFKRVINSNGFGTIDGLNSSSKYRIRMRVVNGLWGEITEINTLDSPKFLVENCLYAKAINECSFQFSKAGSVYGSNQISFGTSKWIIKIISSKNTNYDETETACMSVGVSNKQNKKTVFVGYTLNYGYQKEEVTIKVQLNCEEKKMVIWNSVSSTQQTYQNLPSFPIFPTVINKGNSQVIIKYNLSDQELTK